MVPWLSFDGGRGSFCESWFFDTDTRAVPPLSTSGSAALFAIMPAVMMTVQPTKPTRRVGVILLLVPSLFLSRLPTTGHNKVMRAFRPPFDSTPCGLFNRHFDLSLWRLLYRRRCGFAPAYFRPVPEGRHNDSLQSVDRGRGRDRAQREREPEGFAFPALLQRVFSFFDGRVSCSCGFAGPVVDDLI
jgi:hypothetical protein